METGWSPTAFTLCQQLYLIYKMINWVTAFYVTSTPLFHLLSLEVMVIEVKMNVESVIN